jgi:lipid-binding SYLF domain-containing protein
MVSKRFLIITGAVVLVLSFYAAVSLSQARTSTTKQSDDTTHAENAASVLNEIMQASDQGIPEGLLKRPTGLSSFRMSSRALLGSAAHMIRVVAKGNSDGSLGAPLFIEIAGGSGVESV